MMQRPWEVHFLALVGNRTGSGSDAYTRVQHMSCDMWAQWWSWCWNFLWSSPIMLFEYFSGWVDFTPNSLTFLEIVELPNVFQ